MSEPLATPTDPVAADQAAPLAPPVAQPNAQPSAPDASAPVVAEPSAAIERGRRRRLVALAGLGRVVRFVVMVAIFSAGVALGYARFQVAQTAEPTVGGNPVTAGVEAPASVVGMVQSLRGNDLDAVRSAVAAIRDDEGNVVTDPYRWLAGELQAMRLMEVGTVETLSTYVDGPRTATGLIITGRMAGGVPVSRHLIVQTTNGQIVSFK